MKFIVEIDDSEIHLCGGAASVRDQIVAMVNEAYALEQPARIECEPAITPEVDRHLAELSFRATHDN